MIRIMVDRLTVVDLASVINPMAVLAARGFRSEEVEVLLQRYPADFNIERTNALLDNLEARGIDRGQVNGMVVKLPSILSYTAERTNALLDNLEARGIDRGQVNGMVVKLPSILSCTAERTNALLDNLEARGIDRGQVNGMVVKLPSILSYTAERTNALLEIFEEYYIEFLTKPFRLIFSPRIIRERIEKMKTLGLDVTRFTNKLFYTRKNFEKFEAKYSF